MSIRILATTAFNWADEESALPKGNFDTRSLGFEGHFNFVYGGNLGKAQGLETLVRAAIKASADVPELQLTLIGNGVEKQSLEELARALGATNVQFRPAYPRTRSATFLPPPTSWCCICLTDPFSK